MHGTIQTRRNTGNWTAERIESLKVLWAAGKSCSAIANELGGVTRNAVIGKVSRLGLPMRGGNNWRYANLTEDQRAANREMKRRERRRSARAAYVRGERPRAETRPPVSIADHAIPAEQRRTLFQLENCSCRWPVNDPDSPDFFFCGSPEADLANGIAYCPDHAARAYRRSEAA